MKIVLNKIHITKLGSLIQSIRDTIQNKFLERGNEIVFYFSVAKVPSFE